MYIRGMQKPLISILTPVKNTAPYLSGCIDSILNQSNSKWELLAVDDFSTDNTFQILQSFERKDSRIKAFKNAEKGIIPALQLGLSKEKIELFKTFKSKK